MKKISHFLLLGLTFVCFNTPDTISTKACVNPEHVVSIVDTIGNNTEIRTRDGSKVVVRIPINEVVEKLKNGQ